MESLYWQYAGVHRYFQIQAVICDFVIMLCLLSLDHQKISPGQTHYMIRTEEQVDHGEVNMAKPIYAMKSIE
jgi:hypothetical protein